MRRITPKFEKPHKPWDRTRLESEREILSAYGLRRKQEIWKVESILRVFRKTARELEAKKDKEKEEMFLNRIRKLGLVSNSAVLDDVLALEANSILDRRLQTIVFRKGLASTLKQARQYIVHGHVTVDGRRSSWPSLIVDAEKEKTVAFHENARKSGIFGGAGNGVSVPSKIKPENPRKQSFRDAGNSVSEQIAKAEKTVAKENAQKAKLSGGAGNSVSVPEEKTESKLEKSGKREKSEKAEVAEIKMEK